jgi:hypothetical protein
MGGQHQQTLTVRVKTTRGIDPRDGEEFRERTPATVGLWRELAEHPVGLVKQKGLQGRSRGERTQTFRIGSVVCQVLLSA